MKRVLYITFVMVLSLSLTWAGHSIAKGKFLTLATGSPGGVYYPLGRRSRERYGNGHGKHCV
jgi:TRAP-type uncharacterized transport system substrate-binding protein